MMKISNQKVIKSTQEKPALNTDNDDKKYDDRDSRVPAKGMRINLYYASFLIL